MDSSKFVNAYIDNAMGMIHEQTALVLQLKTQAKVANDIIAEKDDVIHFVEVKYRKNHNQGGGIAAITPAKLKHMEHAAKLWMQRNGDKDSRLSVIEVTGPAYEITLFLEQV